uniref:Serpentine receptor class gamma n=1 Tax=Caenorhabditis tropicalis TaxID=1561998 RepID=A0A1I7T4D3_9PELO
MLLHKVLQIVPVLPLGTIYLKNVITASWTQLRTYIAYIVKSLSILVLVPSSRNMVYIQYQKIITFNRSSVNNNTIILQFYILVNLFGIFL